MKLKKIYKVFYDLHDEISKLYPRKSKQFLKFLNFIVLLTDNLVYEDINENTDRLISPYKWKSNSVLMKCKKALQIITSKNSKNIDRDKLFNILVDIYVQLNYFQWYIAETRRGIHSIIREMEKE